MIGSYVNSHLCILAFEELLYRLLLDVVLVERNETLFLLQHKVVATDVNHD